MNPKKTVTPLKTRVQMAFKPLKTLDFLERANDGKWRFRIS
jgi:hypothetical protein